MAEEIRAEMVGSVLTVLVSEGVPVSAGDPVLLLESMKMEIPVLSESTGTLARIMVSAGDVVRAGDLLALVE